MTASITGRKRCGCGQYKTPLANGTLPRHTKVDVSRPNIPMNRLRTHCDGSGQFPASDKRTLKVPARGQAKRNRRVTKRERKGARR